MSKLRLAHFSVKASTLTRFCLPILVEQAREGNSVEAICPEEEPYTGILRAAGAAVRAIDCPVLPSPRKTLQCVSALRKTLRCGRYDVLYVHQPMGALIGIPAGHLARIPTIFYTTGGFRFHEGMSQMTRVGCMAAETVLMRLVDAVFSPNREDVATAIRLHLVSAKKIFYVGTSGGSGMNCKTFRPPQSAEEKQLARQKIGLPADDTRPVIGIVARTVWEKGYRELLRAFQRLARENAPSYLVIIGDGPHLAEMQRWVADAKLTNDVYFAGNRFDVPDLLRGFDIFALPSHREGLPVSLSEAMATGLPCVATDIRGCRELITHNQTGLLVPPKNEMALFEALKRLRCDVAFARELGARARRRIVEEYSTDRLLPEFIDLNSRLIARRMGKRR